jgi:hypothetical protein
LFLLEIAMTKVSSPPADPQIDTEAPRGASTPAMFDYLGEAELFPTRLRGRGRPALTFRRFARAADAIQYAIETLPAGVLNGTYLEVGDQRYAGAEIRRLYDSVDYPLARPDPRQ